eukprot:g1403.t1
MNRALGTLAAGGIFVAVAAATSKVMCASMSTHSESTLIAPSCEAIEILGSAVSEQFLSSEDSNTSSSSSFFPANTKIELDIVQQTLRLEPMPLYETVPWTGWDQWKVVLLYVFFISAFRKLIIENIWESTWDRIQMRKILVGTLMVYDIASHMSFDAKGVAVYPVWAEIAMVLENFILLRKELMTSPSKWAHDLLLLASFVLVTQGYYYHDPEKVYSRKWMHFHASLFYGAWMLESVFLFCNHKSRRCVMPPLFMKIFLGVTIGCCLHNIFFLLGHAYFVFYDTIAPLAIAVGFTQQWSLWTYKIYTKGVR